jgi:hypothetical protein
MTTTLKSLQELSKLSNNYEGKLPKYQQEGNLLNGSKVADYGPLDFTPYQNVLYKRAIFGLDAYTAKELKGMHRQKKRRVEKVHKKAQASLNILKQEQVINLTNRIFEIWFPDCNITKTLHSMTDPDPGFFNTLDLKDLGLTKPKIVNRFITDGILPGDFYKRKELK